MKALAINGSPRSGGNTRLLLENVLAPLAQSGWETEIVQVGGQDIHGCRACRVCIRNQDRRCGSEEDAFNGVFAKMLAADAIILGSPTYFADMSAEMKALVDRAGFVAMANGYALAGKLGAAVVVARRGGAIHVFDSLNHLFFISQMVVPGSSYWNMAYGREVGEAAHDAEGLRNMRHLGRALDWLGRAMKRSESPYPALQDGEA
jgi:multimeric flavodoxin WrbA